MPSREDAVKKDMELVAGVGVWALDGESFFRALTALEGLSNWGFRRGAPVFRAAPGSLLMVLGK